MFTTCHTDNEVYRGVGGCTEEAAEGSLLSVVLQSSRKIFDDTHSKKRQENDLTVLIRMSNPINTRFSHPCNL